MFSVSIETKNPKAAVDWRLDQTAAIAPHQLPAEVENKLRALMQRLDLSYGAVDLRRRADGSYVFFEVNPGGQFLFAEIHGGQAISRALAKALARRSPEPR